MDERSRQVNEEAAGWLLTLEQDASSETDGRFRDWLERSADHVRAFLEISAVDRDLEGMDRDRRIDLDALIAAVRQDGSQKVVALQEPAPKKKRGFVESHARWIGVAAGLLAVVVSVWLWAPHRQSDRFETLVGEQRAVKLDDGSLVHLNTRSRIEVRFDERAREVRLLEGEALFVVESDTQRPFRVLSGSAVVQVLGTEFNVYRHAQSTTVSVVKGRVKVSDQLVLSEGEGAEVARTGAVSKQPATKVARAVVWRQRQLSFDHDSLAYVAEQFNRYNRLQIRIMDPEVGQRELEGVFNADQPEALLGFLALDENLKIERDADSVSVYLRRNDSPPH
jgi:transmembrane sensor